MTDDEFYGRYRHGVVVHEGRFAIQAIFMHQGKPYLANIDGVNEALGDASLEQALTRMLETVRAKAAEVGATSTSEDQ
jgi:hypothetical protein